MTPQETIAHLQSQLDECRKERQARELAEGENARLKAKLHAINLAVDGYVDGAPDCNAVSKLANEVSLIIDPT